MSEFVTKDSGERVQFESGMVRDTNADKVRYDLVFDGPMFERWAKLLTRGAIKYAPGNWLKAEGAAERDRFKESAVRHFVQWLRGDTDEDHAAAVMFNINGKEYVESKMDLDKCGTTDGVTPFSKRVAAIKDGYTVEATEDEVKAYHPDSRYDGDWNLKGEEDTPGFYRLSNGGTQYVFIGSDCRSSAGKGTSFNAQVIREQIDSGYIVPNKYSGCNK